MTEIAHASCLVPECGWSAAEACRDMAGCLATWHVYEKHPEIWRDLAGNRVPADPDPRVPGQRAVLLARNGLN
jgi:hypothetical protein